MENNQAEEKQINDIYYSPSKAGAYFGPDKVYKVLRSQGKTKPGRYKIRKYLQNQDDYSLQKPVKRKFKRAKVIVSGRLEEFDADLMDVQALAKDNDNTKYLLIVIDDFTKYLFVEPIQNKTAKEVVKALQKVFEKAKPKKLRTDGGSEFTSKLTERYLKTEQIYHHVTLNETKANIAERVILTLRRLIHRYLMKSRTFRYLDVLQKLIQSYNATPHSSLNNIAPQDVNSNNESDIWAYMYLKPSTARTLKKEVKRKRPRHVYGLKMGQLVRISHLK